MNPLALPLGLLQVLGFSLLLAIVLGVGRKGGVAPARRRSGGKGGLIVPAGMAFLSLLMTVLSFGHLLMPGVLLLFLLVGVLFVRSQSMESVRVLWEWVVCEWRSGLAGRAFISLLLVYASMGLVGCLAPETGWDTRAYPFVGAEGLLLPCALPRGGGRPRAHPL